MSIEIEDEVFPKFSTWIHTESGRKNTTAFSEFNVELIDTENLAQKFDQKNVDLEVLTIFLKEIIDRIRFARGKILNYESFGPSFGIFFVITIQFHKRLAKYTSRIMKNVIFMKFAYEVISVFLTYKNFPVKSLGGNQRRVNSTLFKT